MALEIELHMNGPSVITVKEAAYLFTELMQMKGICYNDPRKDCNARAHLMCRYMEEKYDLKPWKLWAFPRGEEYLKSASRMKISCEAFREKGWDYHVAPMLGVVTGPNTSQQIVFDPLVFDGIVTEALWRDSMGGENIDLVHRYHDCSPGEANLSGYGYVPRAKYFTKEDADKAAYFAMQKQAGKKPILYERLSAPSQEELITLLGVDAAFVKRRITAGQPAPRL